MFQRPLIKKVIQELNNILEIFPKPNQNQNRVKRKWTAGVKFALLRAGKHFDYEVYTKIKILHLLPELPEILQRWYDQRPPDHHEWLYDVTACDIADDQKWCTPMVAECEWDRQDKIKEDFDKLMLARAGIRVMVYNGDYVDTNSFLEWVQLHENNEIGDVYLLAASVENNTENNWFFQYHTIIVRPTNAQLQAWED